MTQTYTGSQLQPSVATIPAGLTLTYTGSDSLPQTNIGTYSVGWAINDTNHYGSATGAFQIIGASQTITFTSFTVAARATSGGTVTFSTSTPQICQVAATNPPTNQLGEFTALVTLVTTNSSATWDQCKILANQDGVGTNYNAAPPATAILGNPTAP